MVAIVGCIIVAAGFMFGCYFLACGLEQAGERIRKGLAHIADIED